MTATPVSTPGRGAHPEAEPVPKAVRLALGFDPRPMADEIAALPPEVWLRHFNDRIFVGDWSGIALRTIGGRPGTLYPDPAPRGEWADAPILTKLRSVVTVLGRLRCPQLSARLLRLGPGASIDTHHDLDLAYDDGEVRLHLPVVTSPEVLFLHDGAPTTMAAGACWYLDLTLPHAVHNRGVFSRIHLVVDCVVNDWLQDSLGLRPPLGRHPARAPH